MVAAVAYQLPKLMRYCGSGVYEWVLPPLLLYGPYPLRCAFCTRLGHYCSLHVCLCWGSAASHAPWRGPARLAARQEQTQPWHPHSEMPCHCHQPRAGSGAILCNTFLHDLLTEG